MKLKIKILKENKQKLSEGRYDGLYDVAGIYPGSIDLFIKHFAEVPIEISMDRKDFIESSFGQEIEALRDEDILEQVQEVLKLLWIRSRMPCDEDTLIGGMKFLDLKWLRL